MCWLRPVARALSNHSAVAVPIVVISHEHTLQIITPFRLTTAYLVCLGVWGWVKNQVITFLLRRLSLPNETDT